MTSDPPPDEITTNAEFELALETLLNTATRNNIDIRGSWVCKTNTLPENWEIMIYELEK